MGAFRSLGITAGSAALLALSACIPPERTTPPVPDWLQARMAEYEAGPVESSPSAIWRIQHRGQVAYYVRAPCCDQFNSLWDANGKVLCHPDGGFTGRGDGTCPEPRDAGTAGTLIWSDPRQPGPDDTPWGEAN